MTPATQARTSAPNRRPRAHRPARASTEANPTRSTAETVYDVQSTVARTMASPAGATSCGTTSRAGRSGSSDRTTPGTRSRETDQADQLLEGEVAEPAGVVGTHDVEHQEPEGHGGERLGGDREAAAAEHDARRSGGAGQGDQDGGAATDAEPGPGDGQEDDGGDQQAGRPEPQQDLGDRGALETVPHGRRAGDGHRREFGSTRAAASGCGGCSGGGRGHGGGAQPVEQVVGLTQRAEQLGGEEAVQRQCAGRAAERSVRQRAAAVGTDGGVRVARSGGGHASHCAAPSARTGSAARLSES